jgi:hypothetical protein
MRFLRRVRPNPIYARFVTRICTRCGSQLEAGDRFCGQCGAAVTGVAADPDEPTMASEPASGQAPDFFADWDDDLARGLPAVAADEPTLVPARPDQATTESIPTVKPGDTAVLPQVQAAPQPLAAGPPPGPARVAPRTAPPRQGFPLGATIALLGAAAVIVSALLPWTQGVAGPLIGPRSPREIPFEELIAPGGPTTDPSLGLVLLGIGTLGSLVALITMVLPILRFLRRIIGLVTLAIPGLFVFRIVGAAIDAGALDQVLSVLGVGVYVATAGAVTQLVAGRWFRR